MSSYPKTTKAEPTSRRRTARLRGPMSQEPLIWARVDENKLSLYAFQRTANSEADVQAYHRTLSGGKMKLHFIRYLDGKTVKQTKLKR